MISIYLLMTTGINTNGTCATTGAVAFLARPSYLPATVAVFDYRSGFGKTEGLILVVSNLALCPPDTLQLVKGGVIHT
jgi:hypothetical protein